MSIPEAPDLDMECEELTADEAVERLPDLDEETGIYVKYWESGVGTDHFFVRRVAPMDAEKPFETITGTNGIQTRYPPLGVVESIRNDAVDLIYEAPVKRMPQWGDSSLVISCRGCHRAAKLDDVTFHNGRYYHDFCSPE